MLGHENGHKDPGSIPGKTAAKRKDTNENLGQKLPLFLIKIEWIVDFLSVALDMIIGVMLVLDLEAWKGVMVMRMVVYLLQAVLILMVRSYAQAFNYSDQGVRSHQSGLFFAFGGRVQGDCSEFE